MLHVCRKDSSSQWDGRCWIGFWQSATIMGPDTAHFGEAWRHYKVEAWLSSLGSGRWARCPTADQGRVTCGGGLRGCGMKNFTSHLWIIIYQTYPFFGCYWQVFVLNDADEQSSWHLRAYCSCTRSCHQLGRINGTYKEESSLKGVSGENKHTIGRPKVNLLTIDELKNELINFVINWL